LNIIKEDEIMKKYIALLLCFITFSAFAEKITVYRNGNDLFVQSRWSNEKDIILHICRIANEVAYLVPHNSDIRKYKKGIQLHLGLDDYPATLFAGGQGYGYLSGNHGSAFGVLLELKDGDYSVKDIGTELYDENNHCYRIVQVITPKRILIHPESATKILGRPKFSRLGKKKLFRNEIEVKIAKSRPAQIYPLNRITKLEFLVDGKNPLPDRTVAKCDFLEQIFEHDVIAPEAVLYYLKQNQGRCPFPEFTAKSHMQIMSSDAKLQNYGNLQAIATFKNKYRYQPYAAVVNYRTSIFHISFPNISQMEQMFTWRGKLAEMENDEFYIPKMKLVALKEINSKNKVTYDFSKIVLMPKKLNVRYTLKNTDAQNLTDLPDRFIHIAGNDKREYGVAIGYSLFLGCTDKNLNQKNRTSLYYLDTTKKCILMRIL
jgi:hypothetical protein